MKKEETLHHVLFGAAMNISYKTDELAHLFSNYKSEGRGKRDEGAIPGIGTILEGIADEGRRLMDLLTMARELPLETKLELDSEMPEVEAAIVALEKMQD